MLKHVETWVVTAKFRPWQIIPELCELDGTLVEALTESVPFVPRLSCISYHLFAYYEAPFKV